MTDTKKTKVCVSNRGTSGFLRISFLIKREIANPAKITAEECGQMVKIRILDDREKVTSSQRALYGCFFKSSRKYGEQRKSMQYEKAKGQNSGLRISKRVKQDFYRHFSERLCYPNVLTTGRGKNKACLWS